MRGETVSAQALAALAQVADALDSRRLVADACAAPGFVPADTLIALGKLAAPMAAGWLDGCAARGRAGPRRLIVVHPQDPRYHREADRTRLDAAVARGEVGTLIRVAGEHPEPGVGSLRAGRTLIATAQRLEAGERVQVLLSGGASALAEWPTREGMAELGATRSGRTAPAGADPIGSTDAGPQATPSCVTGSDDGLTDLAERLARWTRRRLASGCSIVALNAARRRISAIKGGGLARRLRARGADLAVWLVADVPVVDAQAPKVVGSAPCWSDEDPVEHRVLASGTTLCREAWRAFAPRVALGAWPLASSCAALDAARPDWGRCPPDRLAVAVGERPVRLPDRPGAGGRAQHLALEWWLAAQTRLAESGASASPGSLLVWASDGFDGSGHAAGVVVPIGPEPAPANVVAEGRRALATASSHAFWRDHGVACGPAGGARLLPAGATGTNLMDLAVWWPWPDHGAR